MDDRSPRATGCPLINNVSVLPIISNQVLIGSYLSICPSRFICPRMRDYVCSDFSLFSSRYRSCHSYLPDFACKLAALSPFQSWRSKGYLMFGDRKIDACIMIRFPSTFPKLISAWPTFVIGQSRGANRQMYRTSRILI